MGLFSKKKKEEKNPYAEGQAPFANPLTPYQQARNNMAQGAPVGLPTGNRAAPPAPSMSSSGYGDDKYGSQSGYGSDRYGSNNSPAPSAGYGGFDDGSGKSDLFGGAGARYVPPQPDQGNGAPRAQAPGGNRNPALFGKAPERYDPYGAARAQQGGADDEYGGYGAARELTGELISKNEDILWSDTNVIQRRRNRNKSLRTPSRRPKLCERRISPLSIGSMPQPIMVLTWLLERGSDLPSKRSACTTRTSGVTTNTAPGLGC